MEPKKQKKYILKKDPFNIGNSSDQFNNRFQGKQDFVTKDGHYGVVSNTKNPITKGNKSEMRLAKPGGAPKLKKENKSDQNIVDHTRNQSVQNNDYGNIEDFGLNGTFGQAVDNLQILVPRQYNKSENSSHSHHETSPASNITHNLRQKPSLNPADYATAQFAAPSSVSVSGHKSQASLNSRSYDYSNKRLKHQTMLYPLADPNLSTKSIAAKIQITGKKNGSRHGSETSLKSPLIENKGSSKKLNFNVQKYKEVFGEGKQDFGKYSSPHLTMDQPDQLSSKKQMLKKVRTINQNKMEPDVINKNSPNRPLEKERSLPTEDFQNQNFQILIPAEPFNPKSQTKTFKDLQNINQHRHLSMANLNDNQNYEYENISRDPRYISNTLDSGLMKHNKNSKSATNLLPILQSSQIETPPYFRADSKLNEEFQSFNSDALFAMNVRDNTNSNTQSIQSQSSFYRRFQMQNKQSKTDHNFESHLFQGSGNQSHDPYSTQIYTQPQQIPRINKNKISPEKQFQIIPVLPDQRYHNIHHKVSQSVQNLEGISDFLRPKEPSIQKPDLNMLQRNKYKTMRRKESSMASDFDNNMKFSPKNMVYDQNDQYQLKQFQKEDIKLPSVSNSTQSLDKIKSSMAQIKQKLSKNAKNNLVSPPQKMFVNRESLLTDEKSRQRKAKKRNNVHFQKDTATFGQNDKEKINEQNQEQIEMMGRNLVYKLNYNKNQVGHSGEVMIDNQANFGQQRPKQMKRDQPAESITQNFYNQNIILMQSPQQMTDQNNYSQGLFPQNFGVGSSQDQKE